MNTVQSSAGPPAPRRYPRMELAAFVEVRAGGETALQLPVRNISRGGVLVGASEDLSSLFALGATLPLAIVDAAGDIEGAARVEARVVRHDARGMALTWDDRDTFVGVVSAFLDRFYSKR